MTTETQQATVDPVGLIVSLVTAAEDRLDPDRVREVVTGVVGGRAKSRHLAAALAARPAVLLDGLSPAPRAIADLLIALRKAGAGSISAPRCAQCGKLLRTFQRRGQDWYCAVCGPRPEQCSACGELRRVATRDHSGQPRCQRCPDEDRRDPIAVIVCQVAALDPAADPEVIAAAARRAASRPSHQQRLAWALENNPALLTGDGHLAPVPAVLRFIDLLCDSGIGGITRPACPGCHRTVRISKSLHGQRVCRTCIAKTRIEQCSRCGARREPATRDERGQPLCPNCLVTDPANLETCVGCGRRRRVHTRGPHGPLCGSCRSLPILVCSICGASAPCGISRLTGQPWCWACQRRSARCTGCDQVQPIRSGTLDQPRCGSCTQPESHPDCPACQDRHRVGQCPDCRLDRRLRELLTGSDGAIHPALQPLHQALASTKPPGTALRWLTRPLVAAFLTEVSAGRRQLTHQELDSLPANPTLAHLRSVLVSTSTLRPRDEHMARLERLLHDLLATRTDPDQRQLLHRYAVWHLLRRLRRRNNGKDTTHAQFAVVRQQVRATIALLNWLATQQLTLATCRQADLERWLCRGEARNRQEAGHFIRWAAQQRLTGLVFPATRWNGPTRALDDQARWDAARRLLHEDTLNTRDRVAGLLILLYAQKTATISRMTTGHIETADHTVQLRLGSAPITLPGPLADLALQLMAEHHGHATTGANTPSPWLFPGGQPGRPISAGHLGQRLKALGIHPGQARSTALFQLATELPAAILARMLGIHINVAVAWQRASSGDWMTYAADISHRPSDNPNQQNPTTQP
ncbi:MAG: hypothetical protein JO281_10490 [Pseudonocardiales bacterium]|nr:hypothetical protein [Pseudonocardiales bacterium]